jgi:hypothetical protein
MLLNSQRPRLVHQTRLVTAMTTPQQNGRSGKQRETLYDIPLISPDKPFQADDGRGVLTGNNRITTGGPSNNSRRTVMKSPLRSPDNGRYSVDTAYGVRKPDSRGTLRSPPPLPSRRGTGCPLDSVREGSIKIGRSSTYTKRDGDRFTSPNPAVRRAQSCLHGLITKINNNETSEFVPLLPDPIIYHQSIPSIIRRGVFDPHIASTRLPRNSRPRATRLRFIEVYRSHPPNRTYSNTPS